MNAIKLNQKVTDKGIKIPIEKIKDFKDKEVEIIITPIQKEEMTISNNKDFLRFAGTLSETESDKILEEIEACRKINKEEWE